MKLADIEVDLVLRALAAERQGWLDAKKDPWNERTEEGKIATDVTICMLAALENVLKIVAGQAALKDFMEGERRP